MNRRDAEIVRVLFLVPCSTFLVCRVPLEVQCRYSIIQLILDLISMPLISWFLRWRGDTDIILMINWIDIISILAKLYLSQYISKIQSAARLANQCRDYGPSCNLLWHGLASRTRTRYIVGANKFKVATQTGVTPFHKLVSSPAYTGLPFSILSFHLV